MERESMDFHMIFLQNGTESVINEISINLRQGGFFMNWNDVFFMENEKPLDRLVDGYSNTGIFRKIGFIGDSLTSGEFESRDANGNNGYHDYYEYSWGAYIARQNGQDYHIFSRGGMTAKEYMEGWADANRLWDPDKACQAYVIALGCNDFLGLKQEAGTVADIDAEDYHKNGQTFIGYYAAIIQRLKKIQPRAKFFLVTMPRENNENDEIREKQRKAVYDMAEYFDKTYVIDLYQYGPVYDKEFRDRFFLYGHMNASGYILTAKMIDSYIDYIIRKNPEDFMLVPYIGTDLK